MENQWSNIPTTHHLLIINLTCDVPQGLGLINLTVTQAPMYFYKQGVSFQPHPSPHPFPSVIHEGDHTLRLGSGRGRPRSSTINAACDM